MKLKIEIEMDNAAFEPVAGDEAARILTKLAGMIAGDTFGEGTGPMRQTLFDANGNSVGEAKVTR